MAEIQQPKNSKAATYLALSGALGFLSTAWIAPLSWPVLTVAVGVAALATNEKGRDFLKKTGDQLMQLGNDVVSHVTEDVGRLQGWWNNYKARRAERQTTINAAAQEKPSTFKNASVKPGFDNAAKPGADATVEAAPAAQQEQAKKAAPAAKPEQAPKM